MRAERDEFRRRATKAEQEAAEWKVMPADEAQRRSIHMASLQADVGYQRMRATLGPARED